MTKHLILDAGQIARKIRRMAYQIWEQHAGADALTLIGIEDSGLVVAHTLAAILTEISGIPTELIPLRINKQRPLEGPLHLAQDLNGKKVILVDDVANSGKTLLYALRPVLDYFPQSVQVAVLVDRKHKSFPVSPDIVGHTLATTLQEHILVEHRDGTVEGVYLQ